MIEINSKKIRPIKNMILVRPVANMAKSKGGIIIPETAKNLPLLGEVLAAGPGAKDQDGRLQPLDVEKGDQVYYNRYAGAEIKTANEELVLLMSEDDVLAVVEK